MTSVHVTKASGEKEVFQESKLRHSLVSAGAPKPLIDDIMGSIQDILYEEIPTQEIYKEAFRLLKSESTKYAGRYKLKEAIMELGPTGYPFERFIGELLNRLGYRTEIGTKVQGDCISHEIDIIARKENFYYMVECKFHNKKGNRCNIQVPLYVQSRFIDVRQNWIGQSGHKNKEHCGYVVTNTRFTQDAQTYSDCVGLRLLSWDYPKRAGLKHIIERLNLQPVTCLTLLTKAEKSNLLSKHITLAVQICENREILEHAGIDRRKQNLIYKEAALISSYPMASHNSPEDFP